MNTTEIKLPQRKRRGRYSNDFKLKLVEACRAPGVSVAAIALANGINANLLRRWIAEHTSDANPASDQFEKPTRDSQVPGFLRIDGPVAGASRPEPAIELRLFRGDLRVDVRGSSADCAAFMRAVLE